jgi:hypothetical protein
MLQYVTDKRNTILEIWTMGSGYEDGRIFAATHFVAVLNPAVIALVSCAVDFGMKLKPKKKKKRGAALVMIHFISLHNTHATKRAQDIFI